MQTNKEEIQAIIDAEMAAYTKKYGKDFRIAVLKILALEKMVAAPAAVPAEQERLIPLSKWNEYHPYPTVGALRQYYFYKDSNGFAECCEGGGMNGGRILINEAKYFAWIKNRKNKNGVLNQYQFQD
jgi:hypothetical protein